MTTGMLAASIGLFGLSRLHADSSYNAMWPFRSWSGRAWR